MQFTHRLTSSRNASSRSAPARAALGVVAVSALLLSACGDGDNEAEFEEAAQNQATSAADTEDVSEDQGPDLPQAEPGLVYEDISQDVTVQDTIRPGDEGKIITPAGTLTIDEVETVQSVPAEEIGQDAEEGEEELAPAEGEEFRILTMSFTPAEDESLESEPQAALALSTASGQDHMQDLDSEEELRVLFSVPQDGSAQLTISSEGHDQYLDILTGERVEDEIAAGYYREVTTQDVNHIFSVEGYQGELTRDGNSVDVTIDYDLAASSVTLAAWSEEYGWAEAGEAWIVVEWNYTFDVEADMIDTLRAEDVDIDGVLVLEDGEEREGHRNDNPGWRENDVVSSFAVPLETTEVELSFEGVIDTLHSQTGHDSDETPISFSSEVLEVEFPDERHGSDPGDVEEAEGDAGEDVDEDEDTEDDSGDGANGEDDSADADEEDEA